MPRRRQQQYLREIRENNMAYKNPEMNKAMQQMKNAPAKIKITSGSSSTTEDMNSSYKHATSMAATSVPRTTGGISGKGGVKVNPLYKDGMAPPATLPKKSAMGKAMDFTK
jgi:hypothetical protein